MPYRHDGRAFGYALLPALFVLQACGRPSTAVSGPESAVITAQSRATASPAARPHPVAVATVTRGAVRIQPRIDREGEALEPWLAELFHAEDPAVRLQALDTWAAEHSGSSLDPVTYALVDPDEPVRARAEEILEYELARR